MTEGKPKEDYQHPYRITKEAGSYRVIIETDDLEFARELVSERVGKIDDE